MIHGPVFFGANWMWRSLVLCFTAAVSKVILQVSMQPTVLCPLQTGVKVWILFESTSFTELQDLVICADKPNTNECCSDFQQASIQCYLNNTTIMYCIFWIAVALRLWLLPKKRFWPEQIMQWETEPTHCYADGCNVTFLCYGSYRWIIRPVALCSDTNAEFCVLMLPGCNWDVFNPQ
jgi:hypothetical protein